MAKSVVYEKSQHAGAVGINMTPMIDCTFQLLIFFVLTAQFASEDLARLVLPRPNPSMAQYDPGKPMPNRIIVNIVSKAGDEKEDLRDPFESGKAKFYKIGMRKFAPEEMHLLEAELQRRKEEAFGKGFKEIFLEIRADKDVNFQYVEAVMMAAAKVGIPKMNITALLEREG